MPYIPQSRRAELFGNEDAHTAGELNYCLTRLCMRYLNLHNSSAISYEKLNTIVGVLECVRHEFLRRMLDPYEDKKIKEHGDVY